MSDTSQGDGWWIASDGKWYPPQPVEPPAPPPSVSPPAPPPLSGAEPQPGVPQNAPPPSTVQGPASLETEPSQGERNKANVGLMVAGLAIVLLLVVGAGVAFFVMSTSSSSSHNSAKDVAQYCTDVAYIDNLGSSFDSASTPTAGQINQLLPIAEKIAKEAPSAVHGDADATVSYLKAAAKGNTAPPSAFQAATAHESAWNTQHCH